MEKFTDELKDLIVDGKRWVKLEVAYAKLTLAEKFSLLMSAMIIGAVCLLMGMLVLVMLSLALVEVFTTIMPTGLAYLTVAGILCLLIVVVFLLRKPLLLDPVARFISKLIIDKN